MCPCRPFLFCLFLPLSFSAPNGPNARHYCPFHFKQRFLSLTVSFEYSFFDVSDSLLISHVSAYVCNILGVSLLRVPWEDRSRDVEWWEEKGGGKARYAAWKTVDRLRGAEKGTDDLTYTISGGAGVRSSSVRCVSLCLNTLNTLNWLQSKPATVATATSRHLFPAEANVCVSCVFDDATAIAIHLTQNPQGSKRSKEWRIKLIHKVNHMNIPFEFSESKNRNKYRRDWICITQKENGFAEAFKNFAQIWK